MVQKVIDKEALGAYGFHDPFYDVFILKLSGGSLKGNPALKNGNNPALQQRVKLSYNRLKHKTDNQVLSELIAYYVEKRFDRDIYDPQSANQILQYIKRQASNDDKFLFDNFANIVKIISQDQGLAKSFIDSIKKTSAKQLNDEEQISRYEYIKGEYPGIVKVLKIVEKQLDESGLHNRFYDFINLVYESIISIEEQGKLEELEREGTKKELLKDNVQEAKCEAPQKKKKKKSKPKNKRGATHGNLEILQEQASEIICTNNDESVAAKLRGALLNLIDSKFPDKESKEFEKELELSLECENKSQVEGHDQKIEQLYIIMVDFRLSRIKHNIENYNSRYGRKIEQAKDKFGTLDFDPKVNKYITSHLQSIASITQVIYNDLKKVRLFLNKITPLVYNEKWLKMSGCDNLELFSQFVDHLHILGEWHNNKLKAVRELDIQNSKKTRSNKQMEREAFNDIKLCVDSLSEFMDTNNRCHLPKALNQEEDVPLDRNSSSAECYGPHQQWCFLSNYFLSSIEVEKITTLADGRHCSC